MNAITKTIIATTPAQKESFKNTYPWFVKLKEQGLNPKAITMDGERSVISAIKLTWPSTLIQRCIWHIKREGQRWLRTYPKTEAGKELRCLLDYLGSIRTIKEQKSFISNYNAWLRKHKAFVKSLPKAVIAYKDLKKTITLISNALPDMFHYLKDRNILSTTGALEGYYSALKSANYRHRGLSKEHRISFVNWYNYYKFINKK